MMRSSLILLLILLVLVAVFAASWALPEAVTDTDEEYGASSSGIPTTLSETTAPPRQVTTTASAASSGSVLDFGAVGDGETDDTAAIQAAIDSLDRVYLPPGVYRVRELTIDRDGFTLEGSGFDAVLLSRAVSVITVENVQGIVLSDFQVEGDYSNLAQRGVTLDDVREAQLRRLYIRDAGFAGIFGTFSDTLISQVRVEHAGDFGIQMKTGSARNRVERSFFSRFASRQYPAHAIYAEGTTDPVIVDNHISLVEDAPGMHEVSGIKVTEGSGGLVEGNIIENSFVAVSLPAANGVTVRGNVGRDLERAGFYILAGASGNLLEDNLVENAPSGFVFDPHPDWPTDTTLTGNRLVDVETPIVSGDSTGTVEIGNSWQTTSSRRTQKGLVGGTGLNSSLPAPPSGLGPNRL